MRLASATVAVLALATTPASAAQIDPAELVLRKADVPVGFELDREESGIRSNAMETKEYPEARVLVRWGRLTGYQAVYTRKTRKLALVHSRADVFRGSDGARNLLAWADREYRRAGVALQKRARVDIGAEGWVHWATGTGLDLSVVVWRQGRVFAGVMALGLTKDSTLALARAQQRRIATALS